MTSDYRKSEKNISGTSRTRSEGSYQRRTSTRSSSGRTGSSAYSDRRTSEPASGRRTAGSQERRRRTSSASDTRSARTRTSEGSSYSRKRRTSRRNRQNARMLKVLLLFVALVVVIGGIMLAMNGTFPSSSSSVSVLQAGTEKTSSSQSALIQDGVYLGNLSLSGLSRREAGEKIENYMASVDWNVVLDYQNQQISIEKYMSLGEDALDTIYSEGVSASGGKTFTWDLLFDSAKAEAELNEVAASYDKEAKGARLTGYNYSTGELVFSDAENGCALDKEKTLAAMKEALAAGNFQQSISASVNITTSDYTLSQAYEDYQEIGRFSTYTSTPNTARDTNITLACQSVCGAIVEKGEEFSILSYIGDTTTEKGYMEAGAYSNGVVIQELGGGICQVSTTLYNAVVKAGLDTTERHNHSMAVHYVNLGEDAMISWPESDLKFINNTEGTLLIIMYYQSSQLTAVIYGIPVLADGVSVAMESHVIEEYPKGIQYVEDDTLEPGTEVLQSSGDDGCKVETYLVTYQNGTEISREFIHNSVYQKRDAVYRRNSSTPTTEAETTEETTDLSSSDSSSSENSDTGNSTSQEDQRTDSSDSDDSVSE